ncbi:hypothetical protein [Subtercola vilae]|uniref:Transmembrane protein n=1 Tax=Subtercola vilae TaxID=2056433 RepID=A0A4T2BMD7_9MICO|nr:hypothetical protein [Subtercola vilae]TIH32250.1 hypothetical protein D4765_15835 [Subtercola vilae]
MAAKGMTRVQGFNAVGVTASSVIFLIGLVLFGIWMRGRPERKRRAEEKRRADEKLLFKPSPDPRSLLFFIPVWVNFCFVGAILLLVTTGLSKGFVL